MNKDKKLCQQCRKFICRCERQRIIREMLYAYGPANPNTKTEATNARN